MTWASRSFSREKREIVNGLMYALDSRNAAAAADYIQQMLSHFGGADLYKSINGVHWVPVTTNGFDNYMNFGFRRLLSLRLDDIEGLVIGTANAYTGHPLGGCEILIGGNSPSSYRPHDGARRMGGKKSRPGFRDSSPHRIRIADEQIALSVGQESGPHANLVRARSRRETHTASARTAGLRNAVLIY